MKWSPIQRWFWRLSLSASVGLIAGGGVRAASPDDHWDSSFGLTASEGGIGSILCLGNDVFFAGYFNQIGGIAATNIARYDGTNWYPLGDGLAGGNLPGVRAMVVCRSQLHAAGTFTEADSKIVNRIARWDGTHWHSLSNGIDGTVFALASDGTNLYAGGHFNVAGGIATTRIGKWDGTNWSALGIGFGGLTQAAVDSLTVDGSNVYVGGRFFSAGGTVSATNIARWDGTAWHALGPGLRNSNSGIPGINGAVRVLRMHRGFLYAGGEFRLAGNISVQNLARWDGTNWSAVGNTSSSSVQALAANGSDLYAGNVGAGIVSKWDGATWSALGSGLAGGGINGGLACNGAELYVGGSFSSAGGKPANNIARWHIPHSLNVDRTGSDAVLSWPATGTNFFLEALEDLSETNWSVVSSNPAIVGDQCRVTNQIDSATRFFRLRRK